MRNRRVTYSNKPSHAARAAHARGEREFRTYDTSAIRPKQSRAPYVIAGVVALIVLIILFNVFSNAFCGEAASDHMVAEGTQVTVTIEDGSTVSTIADTLYDAGLIARVTDFTAAVNAKDAASSLKSGVYVLTGGMSDEEIVDALVAGPNGSAGASLTVAEGTTLNTIADAVATAYSGSITADAFKAAASDASKYASEFSFLSQAGTNSLEGFLYPKTYELISNATAEDVVRQMLTQYQTEVSTLDYSTVKANGLNEYQALILASIVEKEATDDTRSKVAAVFYNRLTTEGDPAYGMLGSDATTAYEVGDNLDSYDWSTDSPYNTRVHKGLPPTPICSPSQASLEAVCNPEANFGDYYFFSFWPDENGNVQYYFDKTYDEHQQTIAAHS